MVAYQIKTLIFKENMEKSQALPFQVQIVNLSTFVNPTNLSKK